MVGPKTLSTFLAQAPVISKVAVQWGHLDTFKHVNNCVYFRYQEIARLRYFDRLMACVKEEDPSGSLMDVDGYMVSASKIGPIVASTECTFKFPTTFPDKLLVGATVDMNDVTSKSYKLLHSIWSLRHNRVVSVGSVTIVSFDYDKGCVVDIPHVLVRAMHRLQSNNCSDLEEALVRRNSDGMVDLKDEF